MSAQTFETWRAVKNAGRSRDAEIAAKDSFIEDLQGVISNHIKNIKDQYLQIDVLQAKLTEAERKLAEIYATEPVAYIGRLPFEMLKHRSLATTLTKHPAFKDDVRLIPLPTPKETP